MRAIVGIDPSLNKSGIAVRYCVNDAAQCEAVGKLRNKHYCRRKPIEVEAAPFWSECIPERGSPRLAGYVTAWVNFSRLKLSRPAKWDIVLFEVMRAVKVAPDPLVIIEGYSHHSPGSVLDLAELGGILRHALWEHGVFKYFEVAPGSLKLFLQKGNLSKDRHLVQAYKRWQVDFDNTDECDAFTLVRMGEAALGEIEATASQLRALKPSRLDRLRQRP